MVTELAKNVYWVGVVDWGLRHFHGWELSTHRGSSYNAYVVKDQKIAVVDTVWGPFADQYIENLREVIDPAKIDYVIANHAETDHSGGLPGAHAPAPERHGGGFPARQGEHRGPLSPGASPGNEFKVVKTGESISLGETQLVFVEAPMLHWPDSMFTYVAGAQSPALQRRIRPALRHLLQVQRPGGPDRAVRGGASSTTRTSSRRSASWC